MSGVVMPRLRSPSRMCGTAAAASSRSTVMRTISEPARANAATCAMVPLMSAVSVLVIDCTTIGAPPPTATLPTMTWVLRCRGCGPATSLWGGFSSMFMGSRISGFGDSQQWIKRGRLRSIMRLGHDADTCFSCNQASPVAQVVIIYSNYRMLSDLWRRVRLRIRKIALKSLQNRACRRSYGLLMHRTLETRKKFLIKNFLGISGYLFTHTTLDHAFSYRSWRSRSLPSQFQLAPLLRRHRHGSHKATSNF